MGGDGRREGQWVYSVYLKDKFLIGLGEGSIKDGS